jgi:hypothetical protein
MPDRGCSAGEPVQAAGVDAGGRLWGDSRVDGSRRYCSAALVLTGTTATRCEVAAATRIAAVEDRWGRSLSQPR